MPDISYRDWPKLSTAFTNKIKYWTIYFGFWRVNKYGILDWQGGNHWSIIYYNVRNYINYENWCTSKVFCILNNYFVSKALQQVYSVQKLWYKLIYSVKLKIFFLLHTRAEQKFDISAIRIEKYIIQIKNNHINPDRRI